MIANQISKALAGGFSACTALVVSALFATPAGAQSTTNQPIVIGGGEKGQTACAKPEGAKPEEIGEECLAARIGGKQPPQPRPPVDRFGLPEPGGVNRLMLESPLARPITPKPSKPILPR